jgi:translation elongation factor EF-1beta
MKIYSAEEQKRVKLIRMEDPYTKLVDGDEGTIVGEDDAGHILVRWDRGSSLSLIPDVDEYEILEKKTFRLIRFNQFVVLESTYQSEWSSSLKKEQIVDLLPKIYQVQTYISDSKTDYVNKVESILEPYDRIVRDFLVELFTINYCHSFKLNLNKLYILDLEMVWKKILEYKQEGLTWGETFKLEPVAYGIKKLVMTCTIVDSLVLLDDVTENIEAIEEYVQSVTIASMNKI